MLKGSWKVQVVPKVKRCPLVSLYQATFFRLCKRVPLQLVFEGSAQRKQLHCLGVDAFLFAQNNGVWVCDMKAKFPRRMGGTYIEFFLRGELCVGHLKGSNLNTEKAYFSEVRSLPLKHIPQVRTEG